VRLWDWSTGQCLQILRGHRDEVWTVAFSPDGNTLASGSLTLCEAGYTAVKREPCRDIKVVPSCL